VRRFVGSRNLVNEKALAHWGLSRQKQTKVRKVYIYFNKYMASKPNLVDARSNAWVCGRSLAGIEGSNPAGGMDVCLF
jgi:hypothetical protein